ncbi:MAG: hypothetical protein D5R98_07755 [Desulfonatronovibrio sp. MSAO_Bac4]|nr:MAG: hypothetical protein D5R98_07755 [Desulfonatronovibrio sp. MSAO_Bac4]
MIPSSDWQQADTAVRHDFFLQWKGRTLFFSKDKRGIFSSRVVDSKSFMYAFFDFPQEDGPEKTYVQGDFRFADVLARRQAEQRGDLGNESVFHVYKKFRTGRNESELIYHIIPRDLLEKTKSQCQISAGCVLLDWTGLLLSLLKKGGSKDQAIALHADSSILMVVGNSSRVKFIRRYPMFSEIHDNMGNVMGMIEHDLEICRREMSADLSELQWIEVYMSSPQAKLPRISIPVRPWPLIRYNHGKKKVWSSLPLLLDAVDPGLALYGSQERYVRPLQMIEKWVIFFLLAAALSLGAIYWMNKGIEDKLSNRIAVLESEVDYFEQIVQDYSYDIYGLDVVPQTVDLIHDLSRALSAPPPVLIWNLFFDSWPEGWNLAQVEITYEDQKIIILTEGTVINDPIQAARQSRQFSRKLVEAGFEPGDIKMNVMSEKTEFSIDAYYPWDMTN